MRTFLFQQLSILLFASWSVQSQCPGAFYTFSGYSSVLQFKESYPNCSELEDLAVSANLNDPIADLTILENLKVTKSIRVGVNVESIEGLTFADSLQMVSISNGSTVSNLDKLSTVRSIFNLEILGGSFYNMTSFQSLEDMWQLTISRDSFSLTGLKSIQSVEVCSFIGPLGGLSEMLKFKKLSRLILNSVDSISSVKDIKDVVQVDSLDRLAIYDYEEFSTLGLGSFNDIHFLELTDISSLSFAGFAEIDFQHTLVLDSISDITDLDSATNLQLTMSRITLCPSLTDFIFFANLDSLITIIITDNPNLTDISALNQADTLLQVVLRDNPLLSFCNEPKICQAIKNPEATVTISGNAAGCGSVEEVAALCAVATQETAADLEVFPLITKQELSFAEQDKVMQISIYNLSGQKVATKYGASCDLSLLGTGVYLYVATSETNQVFTGKFFH